MSGKESSVDAAEVAKRIIIVRGQRVLLDADLAALYGVRTERLNQQVRRNRDPFPKDYVFLLKINELRNSCLQIASSSRKFRGPKRPPFAFTEHGALIAQPVPRSRPIGFTADLDKKP